MWNYFSSAGSEVGSENLRETLMMRLSLIYSDLPGSLTMSCFVSHVAVPALSYLTG